MCLFCSVIFQKSPTHSCACPYRMHFEIDPVSLVAFNIFIDGVSKINLCLFNNHYQKKIVWEYKCFLSRLLSLYCCSIWNVKKKCLQAWVPRQLRVMYSDRFRFPLGRLSYRAIAIFWVVKQCVFQSRHICRLFRETTGFPNLSFDLVFSVQ